MKTFLPSRLFLTWIITMVASLTLGFPLIPGNVQAAGRGKPPPSTDPPPPDGTASALLACLYR